MVCSHFGPSTFDAINNRPQPVSRVPLVAFGDYAITMKIIMMPWGVNEENGNAISKDSCAVATLPKSDSIRIAICQDGRMSKGIANDLSEAIGFRNLFSHYLERSGVELQFKDFSFISDDRDMQRTVIAEADILYVCGFGGTMPPQFKNTLTHPTPYLLELRESIRARVQYNQMECMRVCSVPALEVVTTGVIQAS